MKFRCFFLPCHGSKISSAVAAAIHCHGGKLLQILPGWSSHENNERQTDRHRDTETQGWGFSLRALFLSQVEEMATKSSLWAMRRMMEKLTIQSSQSFGCGMQFAYLLAVLTYIFSWPETL